MANSREKQMVTLVEPRTWSRRADRNNHKRIDGFVEAFTATHKDGFCVVAACPRTKEFRQLMQSMRYIEIFGVHPSYPNQTLIIPRNQNLSDEEMIAAAQQNKELHDCILQLGKKIFIFDVPPFAICKSTLEEMPSTEEVNHIERALYVNPGDDMLHNLSKYTSFAELNQCIRELIDFHKYSPDKIRKTNTEAVINFITGLNYSLKLFLAQPALNFSHRVNAFAEEFSRMIAQGRHILADNKDWQDLLAKLESKLDNAVKEVSAMNLGSVVKDFKGDSVVVGCTHEKNDCCQGELHPRESFFTIDYNSGKKPMLVMALTTPVLPVELKEKFAVTFLECIDFSAYNIHPNKPEANGYRGFLNVLAMTRDDGFVVVASSPRIKEYRSCVQSLNFIELSSTCSRFEEKGREIHFIVIPKNQQLTLEEVKVQLQKSESAKRLITTICQRDYPAIEADMTFCKIAHYKDLLAELNSRPLSTIQRQNTLFHLNYPTETPPDKLPPSQRNK